MAPSKSTEREAREARERLRRYNARQTVHADQLRRRKRDNLLAVGGVILIAALAAVTQVFYFTAGPGMPTPAPSASADASQGQNVGDVPDPSLAEGRSWTGELTLNEVPLGISLDGALAPQAVSVFIAAAQDGYYVDKSCHRLVESSTAGLIQCGSLDGTGASDPSFSFGPIENAPAGGVYPAGTIAIARGDSAYSNGRQFFITMTDSTLPDTAVGGYTVIGTVTSGLDQLISQIAAPGITGGGQDGPPVVPTRITALTIQ